MRVLDRKLFKINIDKRLAKLGDERVKELLGLVRWKKAEMSLSLAETLVLLFEFRLSGIGCMKAFWLVHMQAWRDSLRKDGRVFPSYQIFHKWLARCEELLEELLKQSLPQKKRGLWFVDSTKLPIGEEYRWIKAMGQHARRGHSSIGTFYGMKLHAVIDDKGSLGAFKISPGNVHDLTPIKEGLLDGITGRMHGDRGYISREVRYALMDKGLNFLARPKENMGSNSDWSFEYVETWKLLHAKEYRKRMGIERFFSRLKRAFNMSIKGLRSPRMARSQVFSALLASQWELSGDLGVLKIV
jgi:hypothetical protein